jgi:hypothetical protein
MKVLVILLVLLVCSEGNCKADTSITAIESYPGNMTDVRIVGEDDWHVVFDYSDRKDTRRKFNYAYKMWLKYDAKRSWEKGLSGATFLDGKGWHQKRGKKYQNAAMKAYGRWIPFMGYNEEFYKMYYEEVNVFLEKDKTRKGA